MLINTRGIVLQQFKYSETSLIIKIYTEELGLQSYIVKGIRSQTSKQKLAYFQPLSLVDMVVYYRENKQLQKIKEIKSSYAWHHIPFSVNKQTVLLFLDEILYKTLREESPNKKLFSFIYDSLHWFDIEEDNFLNFHLFFLLQFSRYLGFSPKLNNNKSIPEFFDLQEGVFISVEPLHPYFIRGLITRDLHFLLHQNIDTVKNLKFDTTRRRNLLDTIITYYQLHLPEIGIFKSLRVLTDVMH